MLGKLQDQVKGEEKKKKENNTCLWSWSTGRPLMCCLLGNRDGLMLH